jgi:hypothetical protein
MKYIKSPPIETVIETLDEITVSRWPAKEVGYCNACTDRDVVVVFLVRLRSLCFRLCYNCKQELLGKLSKYGRVL